MLLLSVSSTYLRNGLVCHDKGRVCGLADCCVRDAYHLRSNVSDGVIVDLISSGFYVEKKEKGVFNGCHIINVYIFDVRESMFFITTRVDVLTMTTTLVLPRGNAQTATVLHVGLLCFMSGSLRSLL